ncbi:MAG TPA: phosphoglycolate phosphatase [Gammaproteobacteria bacterium]|nr:phosphoglycolate phosphatase [Gammaproteobacteria bacterium]
MELIIFDLDGTLVDSVPDLAQAVNHMLVVQGKDRVSELAVRQWVGNGALRLLKRALTGTMDGEPNAQLLEASRGIFFDAYSKHLCDRSRLYPGVAQVLSQLQADGYRMACVTNKPAAFTLPLLRALHIDGYFEKVVSGDSLAVKKPDPGPLLAVLESLAVSAERTMMVGDSISDYRAAQASGIAVILVTYGYHQGMDLQPLAVHALVDDFTALPTPLGVGASAEIKLSKFR